MCATLCPFTLVGIAGEDDLDAPNLPGPCKRDQTNSPDDEPPPEKGHAMPLGGLAGGPARRRPKAPPRSSNGRSSGLRCGP